MECKGYLLLPVGFEFQYLNHGGHGAKPMTLFIIPDIINALRQRKFNQFPAPHPNDAGKIAPERIVADLG